MQRSSIATGHEEYALGGLRMEAKSGAQVRPLATAFDKARKQSEASRAVGDNRPFIMAAVPEPEGKRVIYAFESRSTDELRTKVAAFAVQLGLIEQ